MLKAGTSTKIINNEIGSRWDVTAGNRIVDEWCRMLRGLASDDDGGEIRMFT